MSATLLQVTDLAVTFETGRGPVRAVDGISLSVARGESVGIVGESGSGKSALAMSLMGLLPDYARLSGSIDFDGAEVLASDARQVRELRGRRIAMVFQDPNASLNPMRTVGAQLVETLRVLRGLGHRRSVDEAAALLDRVGLPEPRRQLAAYPHELSGGMRQRVMIALALAGEPDLLIADEATTALDVSVQAQILALLQDIIRERGMSLLMITHDLGIAASVSDRVMVMYSGRLAEIGSAGEVFARPTHPYTYALLRCIPDLDAGPDDSQPVMVSIEGQAPDPLQRPTSCAFADRCPLVHDRCREQHPPMLAAQDPSGTHLSACWASQEASEPIAVQVEAAEAAEAAIEPAPAAIGVASAGPDSVDPLLRVTDLQVRYRIRRPMLSRAPRRLVAVRDISLELRRGQTLGLVGESGSGKSSTARAVLRLENDTGGSVLFEGAELVGLPERRMRRLRPRLQMVMQDITTSLSPRFTVEEAVSEPLRAHGIEPTGGRRAYVERLLGDVSLPTELAGRPARELSGGQRQRVNLARALATDPALIVADEPTSALDVSVRAQILNLMRRLQTERQLAYLFISHDLTVIRQMCDRIAVMYLGKVVEVADREQLFGSPRHPYTEALLGAIPRVGHRGVRTISGELPSPLSPPSGCPFRTRCPKAQSVCAERDPALETDVNGHAVACFFPGDTLPIGNGSTIGREAS